MIYKQLRQIWEQLRAQKPSRENFLDEVHIKRKNDFYEFYLALKETVIQWRDLNGSTL